MMLKFRLAATICFAITFVSYGQTNRDAVREQFTPREVVVFSEDFSTSPVGANPANWGWLQMDKRRILPPFSPKDAQWVVAQSEGTKELDIKTSFFLFYPGVDLSQYLRDSFTLSCEFNLATTFAQSDISLMNKKDTSANQGWKYGVFSGFTISRDGSLDTHIGEKRENVRPSEPNTGISIAHPVPFDTAAWHHLGVSYTRGNLKIYLDSFLMLHEPHYRYSIDTILFGGWATVKYRNIKIATGPQAQPLQQLLRGRTLSTHAILFDAASAIVKPGSYAFLNELVEVLKNRISLKLEICGHTDSDGSDVDNQALSERRAGAVRDYLVAHGIAAARLTTKGYGETQPLRRGNSEQDKATNRRVEFVPK